VGETDLRLAERRVVRRQTDVAGERELGPPAEGEAVDRGDDRLRRPLDQLVRLLPGGQAGVRLQRRPRRHLADVAARAEGAVPTAGEDQDAQAASIAARTTRPSSRIVAVSMAFKTSGRLIVTRATGPRCSDRTVPMLV